MLMSSLSVLPRAFISAYVWGLGISTTR
jgi:hypothetical protein